MALPRTLRPIPSLCTSCARPQLPLPRRRHLTTTPHPRLSDLHSASSRLPRVATGSFWSSLVPKPFRRKTPSPSDDGAVVAHGEKKGRREWNPYTPILVLALLVGSNAIQLLALRNEMTAFSRKTDAKLELLREVIGKVRRGEMEGGDAEIKRALGTGDRGAEAEWEAAVQEVEETDVLALAEGRREEKRRVREREREAERGRREEEERRGASPVAGGEAGREGRAKFLM